MVLVTLQLAINIIGYPHLDSDTFFIYPDQGRELTYIGVLGRSRPARAANKRAMIPFSPSLTRG